MLFGGLLIELGPFGPIHGKTLHRNLHEFSIIQWSQKVRFRPETGPECPENDNRPKLFGTNLFQSGVFNTIPGVQILLANSSAVVNFLVLVLSFCGNSRPVSGQKLTSCDHCILHLFHKYT